MEDSDDERSIHSHGKDDELVKQRQEHEEGEEVEDGDDNPENNKEEEEEGDSEPEFDCEPVRKKSRLDYLRVIAGPEKARISNGFRDLAISLNAGRNRRPGTLQAAIQGFSTAYVDQDTSGTYDPKRVRATPPPTPISRPIRERPQKDENGQLRPGNGKRKRVGYTFPVKLTLKSKKGLDYLKSIPEGPYSSESEAEDETLISDSKHDSGYVSPLNKLRRSRRVKTSALPKDITVDQVSQSSPQSQGCKGCLELGETECCVIRNKYSWPCDACVDAGIECEMIIPFELKTGCLRCRRKRIKCPFRDDAGKGLDRCSNCEEVDEPCIAGPVPKALEYKYEGVNRQPSAPSRTKARGTKPKLSKAVSKKITLQSRSPSPQQDPARPQRAYVGCNQCRGIGERCSLKKGRDGPCSSCKKAGEICRFVYEPTRIPLTAPLLSGPTGHNKNSPAENQLRNSHVHSYEDNTRQIFSEILNKKKYNTTKGKTKSYSKLRSNSRIVRSVPERPRAKLIGWTLGIEHITIITSFCHPIRFHYVPDPDNRYPCSWCDSPVFGLWGHSPKEVEVIPYGKNGNEEISGGHSEDGVDQTKMCCNCTLERISIMYCEGHLMKPIEGLDPKTLDLGAIGQSLVALAQDDHVGAELVNRVNWCSICVAPAEYSCNDQGEGCGLHLCQTCNDLLARLQKSWTASVGLNLMDELVKLWKADLWKREDMGELRADAEFLLTTGELSVRMNLGMEMSSFEDGNIGPPKEVNPSQSFHSSQSSQGSMSSANSKGNESQDTTYSGHQSQNNSSQQSDGSSLPAVRVFNLPQTPGPRKVPGIFGSPTSPDTIEPHKFTIPASPKARFNPALTALHAQARANASAIGSMSEKSAKATQELTRRSYPSHLPYQPTAHSVQFTDARKASATAKKQDTDGHTTSSRPTSSSSAARHQNSSSTNSILNKRHNRRSPPRESASIDLLFSDEEDILSRSARPRIPVPAQAQARNFQHAQDPCTGFRFLDEVDVEMDISRTAMPKKAAPNNFRFLDEVDVEMEMGSRPGSSSSKKAKATNFRFLDEVDVDMEMDRSSERRNQKVPQKWNGIIPAGAELINLGD